MQKRFFVLKSKYDNKVSKISFHFFCQFFNLKRNAISGFYFDVSNLLKFVLDIIENIFQFSFEAYNLDLICICFEKKMFEFPINDE